MRQTSARFREAITGTHQIASRVTLTSPTGEQIELEPVEGSVTLDATAANRGRCDLTLELGRDDLELVPGAAGDALTPFGSEVRIERGVTYVDGSEELVGLGVFGIDNSRVRDAGDELSIALTGLDRSAKVAADAFEAPFQVDEGTLFTDAIKGLIRDVFPGIAFNAVDSDRAAPQCNWEEGEDRFQVAQELALGLACELFFDGDGIPTLRPAGAAQVVAELVEGEGATLTEVEKEWSREGIHNRWIITGENSGGPIVRGIATDARADSPTRYGGPFGRVPRFETYSFVHSTDQANEVAAILKAKELGQAQGVNFSAITNPALEPDDVVRITRARAGVDELHIVDALTIPLSGEAMAGTTRIRL